MTDSLHLRDQFGQNWQHPFFHADVDPTPTEFSAVWLVFIPGAFTPVCTRELAELDELANLMQPYRIGVRAVAVDSVPVLRFVAEEQSISAPLLSDFWPHGEVAQLLDAFDAATGKPLRHSVLVDKTGNELARISSSALSERSTEKYLEKTARIGEI